MEKLYGVDGGCIIVPLFFLELFSLTYLKAKYILKRDFSDQKFDITIIKDLKNNIEITKIRN